MSGPVVREGRPEDSGAIAALLNAHSAALHGEPDVTESVASEWLANPDVEIFLAEAGGTLVCYGDLVLSVDGAKADLDVRAHPASPKAAGTVLEALEQVAKDRGATRVRAYAESGETVMLAELAGRGYRPIRHSFRMSISLDREITEPVWPEGVLPRTVAEGEERAAHEANNDAFADHWGFEAQSYERWARWNFESDRFDRSLNFVAAAGPDIAGICLCSLHWSGDPHHGWVGILGVRPSWRRRGLGLALLRHAFAEFARRGCDRVGLGVDAESTTGALELYERAGMHVERRQDTFELSLA